VKFLSNHALSAVMNKASLFGALLILVIAAVAFESTCAPSIDSSLIPNLDKIIHFCVFGVIALLLASVLATQSKFGLAHGTIAILSLVSTALLGCGDEYLQSFNATRHAELDDVIADVAGAATVLVIWSIMQVKKTNRHTS